MQHSVDEPSYYINLLDITYHCQRFGFACYQLHLLNNILEFI